MPKLDIYRTSQRIKAAFMREKAHLLHNRYKPSPRQDTDENFNSAAALCIELKACPEDFVSAAFDHCRAKNGPFADALSGNEARQWYNDYCICHGIKEGEATKEIVIDGIVHEISLSAENDVMFDFKMTLNILRLNCKPENQQGERVKILRDPHFFLPIVGRILAGGQDHEVVTRFRQEAIDYFHEKPHHLAPAVQIGREIGVDIQKILGITAN